MPLFLTLLQSTEIVAMLLYQFLIHFPICII